MLPDRNVCNSIWLLSPQLDFSVNEQNEKVTNDRQFSINKIEFTLFDSCMQVKIGKLLYKLHLLLQFCMLSIIIPNAFPNQ